MELQWAVRVQKRGRGEKKKRCEVAASILANIRITPVLTKEKTSIPFHEAERQQIEARSRGNSMLSNNPYMPPRYITRSVCQIFQPWGRKKITHTPCGSERRACHKEIG